MARPDPLPRLHSLPLIAAVTAGAVAILLAGMRLSPDRYGEPRFILSFFPYEVGVTLYLAVATFALAPFARVGFRAPTRGPVHQWLPVAVLLATALGVWLRTRLSVPDGPATGGVTSLEVLRTTALVGLNEEWLFRGLILVCLCARLGRRRGAFLALLLFGLFHTLNVLAGEAPAAALFQALATTVLGATFLLAAIGTGSLLVPIVAHGLYDFAVFDVGRLAAAADDPVPAIALFGALAVTGIAALVGMARLREDTDWP